MKLIIFKPLGSVNSALGYIRSVRIGYILNMPIVSVGISEQDHTLLDYPQNMSIEAKIKYLLKCYEPGEARDSVLSFQDSLKQFKAAKNKASKLIVAWGQLKKMQEMMFAEYIKFRYKILDDTYKIGSMAGLIDPDKFHFYDLQSDIVPMETKSTLTKVELLRLLLPDQEGAGAMFFLDRQKMEYSDAIEICNADEEGAADPKMTYAQYGFTFPMVEVMSTNEIAHARTQFEEHTMEFREKLDEWAAVCYESPEGNAGLEFFRKNLDDFLPTLCIQVLESDILKNISNQTREKNETLLLIGQAPIQRIWRYYCDTMAISEEEYSELMEIKKEQYPKYEGRWPVMFASFLVDDLTPEDEGGMISYSRKRISVD